MIHGRFIAAAYVDTSAQNIPSSWTQITNYQPSGTDPAGQISHLAYRNTSSTAILIGYGTTGNVELAGILAPNACMDSLPFKYDPGRHIFVQSITGTISSGVLTVNFYQTRAN